MAATRTVLGMAVVACGASLLAASPAQAETQTQAARAGASTAPAAEVAAACWGVTTPSLSGRTVRASGWATCNNPSAAYTAILQRERWYGWETLDREKWWGKGSRALSKGCKAGTTYTYRAYVTTWPSGSHKYSAKRRYKCR